MKLMILVAVRPETEECPSEFSIRFLTLKEAVRGRLAEGEGTDWRG